MRLIVAGSRSFNDYQYLYHTLDKLLCDVIKRDVKITIIHGDARGPDRMGGKYAKDKGYEVEVFPANWDEYGKAAGYRRNKQMATNADALCAFWDGQSKGTAHMIDLALDNYLNVRVIRFKGGEHGQ
ncbi:DUF2493 domain-containing protein [Endozoicomonas sp. ONNA1]|uniref:DUF2493 domain-containing protein n=1 Tax=Endozoicomonas sp. ONNA1 TaxID=2828740 RepID=UPI002147DB89|nr:DUF2493 domain-containing protein [Endozoicomonas sp. ONNA1]